MDVYQCPDCELKFRNSSELRQHIAIDHPKLHLDTKEWDDSTFSAWHHRRHHHRPMRRD